MTKDFIEDFTDALHKEGRPFIVFYGDSSDPECGFHAFSGGLTCVSQRGYSSRREAILRMIDISLEALEHEGGL
jgi:hypothetical protein